MDAFFLEHGDWRAAMRGLGETDIEYIKLHGTRFHRNGALIYYLRRRDIPVEHRAVNRWARLEGCAVVLDRRSGLLITTWRNRREGLKRIRRKPVHYSPGLDWLDDMFWE